MTDGANVDRDDADKRAVDGAAGAAVGAGDDGTGGARGARSGSVAGAVVALNDQWAWWRAAFAGKLGPMREDRPESGFYRTKDGAPVAFWLKDGEQFCLRDGERVASHGDILSLWVSVAKKPVSKELYDARRKDGRWPDQPEAPAQRGNMPADPFEALKSEFDDKLASAEAWLKAHPQAKDQTESDYARNLQAELLKIEKVADGMHKAEKQPHLDAGRAVDDKFRFRERVAPIAKALRDVFGTFMAAEEERQRKAARAKFEAEKRAAEAARREIEAQREKQMRDDPIAALTSPEPELPMAPIAPEAVKVKAGGGVGRAAGLRTEYVPEITDYDAALAHFAHHDDVRALVDKLVKAATRAGKSQTRIPGVTIHERRVAA